MLGALLKLSVFILGMIQESFVILPGVRLRSEVKFWSQSIHSWGDFLSRPKVRGLSSHRKSFFDDSLRLAKTALNAGDSGFFSKSLPFSEQWRLFEAFRDEAVYLDIETNGYHSGITVIGLSDGVETKTLVKGFNLDKALLQSELSKYKLLVTFNGASFDVPVIERYFGFKLGMPHVDLRFVCQRIGLTGGLKEIERQTGIKRRAEVEGIRGEDAVYLWEMWRSTGNREYLEKLVMYNEEDILNLKPLAKLAIPKLWEKTRYGAVKF